MNYGNNIIFKPLKLLLAIKDYRDGMLLMHYPVDKFTFVGFTRTERLFFYHCLLRISRNGSNQIIYG